MKKFLRLLLVILAVKKYHDKVHGIIQFAGKIRGAILFMLTIAIALITIGVFFLLQNFGVIPEIVWGTIWPSVLIIVGVYLFVKVHHFYSFIRKMHKMADKIEKKFMHPMD